MSNELQQLVSPLILLQDNFWKTGYEPKFTIEINLNRGQYHRFLYESSNEETLFPLDVCLSSGELHFNLHYPAGVIKVKVNCDCDDFERANET